MLPQGSHEEEAPPDRHMNLDFLNTYAKGLQDSLDTLAQRSVPPSINAMFTNAGAQKTLSTQNSQFQFSFGEKINPFAFNCDASGELNSPLTAASLLNAHPGLGITANTGFIPPTAANFLNPKYQLSNVLNGFNLMTISEVKNVSNSLSASPASSESSLSTEHSDILKTPSLSDIGVQNSSLLSNTASSLLASISQPQSSSSWLQKPQLSNNFLASSSNQAIQSALTKAQLLLAAQPSLNMVKNQTEQLRNEPILSADGFKHDPRAFGTADIYTIANELHSSKNPHDTGGSVIKYADSVEQQMKIHRNEDTISSEMQQHVPLSGNTDISTIASEFLSQPTPQQILANIGTELSNTLAGITSHQGIESTSSKFTPYLATSQLTSPQTDGTISSFIATQSFTQPGFVMPTPIRATEIELQATIPPTTNLPAAFYNPFATQGAGNFNFASALPSQSLSLFDPFYTQNILATFLTYSQQYQQLFPLKEFSTPINDSFNVRENDLIGSLEEQEDGLLLEPDDNSPSPTLPIQPTDKNTPTAEKKREESEKHLQTLVNSFGRLVVDRGAAHARRLSACGMNSRPTTRNTSGYSLGNWLTPPYSPHSLRFNGPPILHPNGYSLSQGTGLGGAIRPEPTQRRGNTIYDTEQRPLNIKRNAFKKSTPEPQFVYDATFTPIVFPSKQNVNPFADLHHGGGAMRQDRRPGKRVGEGESLSKKLSQGEKRNILREMGKEAAPLSINDPQPIFLNKFLDDVHTAKKVARCVSDVKHRLNLVNEYVSAVTGIPSQKLSNFLKVAKQDHQLSSENWNTLKPVWCTLAIWMYRIMKNPEVIPGLRIINQKHIFHPACQYSQRVSGFNESEKQRLKEVFIQMETPDRMENKQ